jgi:hypothetical protein
MMAIPSYWLATSCAVSAAPMAIITIHIMSRPLLWAD